MLEAPAARSAAVLTGLSYSDDMFRSLEGL